MSKEVRKEFAELLEISKRIDKCENALFAAKKQLDIIKIKELENSSNIDALLKKIDDYKKKIKE